ncbi:MAG: hypothetical protein M1836_000028 [Candelina mexicana]|nr:MAG: hypothetical protein M1836_000028 [Candelina mexicana]
MEPFSKEILDVFETELAGDKNKKVFGAVKRARFRMYLDTLEVKINKTGLSSKEYHQQHAEKQYATHSYLLINNQIYRRAEGTFLERIVACEWDAGRHIIHGIKVINGRPRTPQTQRLVEQANRVVKKKIRSWMAANGKTWATGLVNVVLAMNRQVHASLPRKVTPYEVIFGWSPKILNKVLLKERGSLLDIQNAAVNSYCSGAQDETVETAIMKLPIEQSQQAAEAEPGAEPDAELGAEPDAEPDAEPGAESGAEPGTESGAEAEPEVESEAETEEENVTTLNKAVKRHQKKVRAQMQKKYDEGHKIVTFCTEDFATLAISRDDCTSTDNTHILIKVIDVSHHNRYQLQTIYDILNRLYSTSNLNIVSEAIGK